jgi:glucokinase
MFESTQPGLPAFDAFPRLLGDIGGTNARFGWQAVAGAPITQVQVLPCLEHPTLLDAIRAYLAQQGLPVPPCAALGIANPVTGDAVRMTNHAWAFTISGLRESLGLQRLLFVNDFTALALSLTTLSPDMRRQVGGGEPVADAAIGLIGPGTGLGVSGLVPVDGGQRWWPIAGEGGHVTLSARTEREFRVIQALQARYGHVSAERVLSGAGLVDLYHALLAIEGKAGIEIVSPAQVLERASEHPTSAANEALDLFCGFLGSMAGDLALTLGARGGVYVGGGIVPRLGARFAASPFRSRFEDKGRFQAYLQAIPVWVIDSPVSPALQGAAQALALSAGATHAACR